MDPIQNCNSSSTSACAIDLYARAAATLYGIISIDNFLKILTTYYGEGTLSRERIRSYFRSSENDDPVYYIQDKLIVHASIPPDEIKSTLTYIQRSAGKWGVKDYRILPEKELLKYADPFYHEDTHGTRQMGKYLTNDLGILRVDAREILREMVFVCRTGACPTFIMDALTRRGLPFGRVCNLDLITHGCEMEPEIRHWEKLGYTGRETSDMR